MTYHWIAYLSVLSRISIIVPRDCTRPDGIPPVYDATPEKDM